MALHVKKGDTVEIIAGDHKGSTGRVLRVIIEKQQVIVQGHNVSKNMFDLRGAIRRAVVSALSNLYI